MLGRNGSDFRTQCPSTTAHVPTKPQRTASKPKKRCFTQSNGGKPCGSKPTHNLKEREVPASAIQSTHLAHCPSSQAAVHSNTGSSSAWWNSNKIAAKGKTQGKTLVIRSIPTLFHLAPKSPQYATTTGPKDTSQEGSRAARETKRTKAGDVSDHTQYVRLRRRPSLRHLLASTQLPCCKSWVRRYIRASDAEGGRRER